MTEQIRTTASFAAAFFFINFCFLPPAAAETTACNFMYLNKTAYNAGMGNLDGIFTGGPSVTGNPALLAYNGSSSLLLGGGDDEMLATTGKFDFILGRKNLGLGFGFFSYNQSFGFLNAYGESSGKLSHNGNIVSLAAGYSFSQKLSLGVGFQNIGESFEYSSQKYEDSSAIFNLGLLWKYKKLRTGFHMVNIGSNEIWEGDKLPAYGTFSLGYETEKFRAGFSGGSDQLTGRSSLGMEYRLFEWFAIRTGVESTDEAETMTFGFSLNFGSFGFDFAAVSHEDLGSTSITALKYAWGGGEDKEVKKEKPVKKAKPLKKPKPVHEPVKKAAPVELPEVPEDEKVNVAVTDFEARAPLSQSEAAFISDFVRADIVGAGRFNVVDKNNMDKVLAEQGFQQTGCSSAECAVQIGKILNVKMMIVGSCGQLLGKYIITLNVVSVESAKIVYSDDVSVADPDDLRDNIRALIEKFSRTIK